MYESGQKVHLRKNLPMVPHKVQQQISISTRVQFYITNEATRSPNDGK